MAGYCTSDDIARRMRPDLFLRLTDEDGDGQPDAAVLATVIEASSDLVDGYCQKRYAVPFSPVPPVVQRLTVDLAIYELYARRGIDEDSADKAVVDQRKAAIEFFMGVGAGRLAIGTGSVEPHNPPSSVRVHSRPQVFTEELMGKF